MLQQIYILLLEAQRGLEHLLEGDPVYKDAFLVVHEACKEVEDLKSAFDSLRLPKNETLGR